MAFNIFRRFFDFLGATGVRRIDGQQIAAPLYSNAAAVPVNTETALQLSSVWACVKILSESIASLPIKSWEVDKDGKKTPAPDYYLYNVLNGKPNPWQTRQEFFETMMLQLFLHGNAYAAITRNGRGEVLSLLPLMAEQMKVELIKGDIVYTYSDGNTIKVYAQNSIWHLKLLGNGVVGLSTLGYARNTVGIGLAAEQTVTKIYQSGGKPSGLLTIDNALTPEQKAVVRKNFNDITESPEQGRLFVLEAGFKFQPVSLSPEDIELLASRRYQVEDIARFFGVPSVLINDTSGSTAWGSGISQIVEGFYKFTLRPNIERIESSIKAWLMTREESRRYEIEFDFSSLLRPSYAERVEAAVKAVQGGLLAPNEFRKDEGQEPQEGGDNLFMQQQMTPIKLLEGMAANQVGVDSNGN